MYGFKSFVDKTELEFNTSMTAIVGPNGCGKSNICDSIKWVLGEQSAKSLRGSRMEDVIFHGTDTRKPLAMAEVSLFMDNSDGSLPIDYQDVMVTRRLFRSGESEYLINNSICRLKDVEELFLDTGAGHKSYSVIEQGQLALVLSIKPSDRRLLFEEAAGIAKFKARKEEALRKLEATEQNLLRINDIISEVKRQIGSIERQAKRAEKYKELQTELKSLEIKLGCRQYQEFQKEITVAEQSLDREKAETEGLSASISASEAKAQELRLKSLEEEKILMKHSEDIHRIDTELERTESAINLRKERLANFEDNKRRAALEIEMQEKKILGLEKREQEIRMELSKLSEESMTADADLKEGNTATAKVSSDLTSKEVELEKMRTETFDILNRLSQVRSQTTALEANAGHVKAQIAKVKQEMQTVSGGKLQLAELERVFSQIKQKTEALSEDVKNSGRDVPKAAEISSRLQDILYLAGQVEELLKILKNETMLWDERVNAMDAEKNNLEAEIEEMTAENEKLRKTLSELEKEYAVKQNMLEKLQNEIDAARRDKEETGKRLTQTEVRIAKMSQQVQHLQQEMFRMDESAEESRQRVKELRTELDSGGTNKEKWTREIKEDEGKIDRLFAEKDKLEKLRQEQEQVRFSVQESLAETEKDISRVRHEREKKETGLYQLEMKKAQIKMQLDNMVEKLQREYRINIADDSSFGDVQVKDDRTTDEIKAETEKIFQKINEIGAVNLVAMEEYEELSKRFEFLTTHEKDLRDAKESLHNVINNINQTTRKLFKETFDKVRENFRQVFKRLFQGGESDLMLVDEADLMETGIDIVARPPGKRLQNIMLLSGGESALTAVALLFALFMVKPSPFCILDEIDAPLDEANVIRFTELLKEFAARTQFIIITHNKKTMEVVDTLYGVTMEEAGVSRIISYRLAPEVKAV